MDFIWHVVAGAGVGFAIGLTGVGGGSLMTPLLLAFGYAAPVAIGTDLLYAALTKAGGAISHHRRGNVNWRIVGMLALGSLPASLCLHLFVLDRSFQASQQFEELLTKSLGIMLILTSIMLIFRTKLRIKAIEDEPRLLMGFMHRHRSPITIAMGVVLGICVTLSSVGAGAFAAAILLVIYSTTSTVRIIGTDIAHAVPLTLFAGLGYLVSGYVDFILLLSLLVGSIPAISLGSRLSNHVPERVLQLILIGLLLLLGANYTLR